MYPASGNRPSEDRDQYLDESPPGWSENMLSYKIIEDEIKLVQMKNRLHWHLQQWPISVST